MLDYLDKANDLIDFAKNISAPLKQFSSHKQVLNSRGKKGDKTILALAKLAAKTGSELEMFRRSKDGETTFVRLSPAIGKDIIDRSEAQRTRAISPPRHLAPMDEKPNAGRDSLEGFLISAAESGRTLDDADDALMVLLVDVIRALRATPDGLTVLNEIRSKLQSSGRRDAVIFLDDLLKK